MRGLPGRTRADGGHGLGRRLADAEDVRQRGDDSSVVASDGICLTAGGAAAYDAAPRSRSPPAAERTPSTGRHCPTTLRDATGERCLDIVDAQTAAGSAVQSFACNGTPDQVWVANAQQELFNPQSGRCLDGSRMTIMDCTGKAGQRWRLPTG
ncbi:RICIN domain-containing protein [Streptomyces sp. NBC_01176]|uniref:RICIN domain-containing protein n=1 Tax=Streptomyces sp. NBC_01176 TaxID=2903760 RepID=UPI002F910AE4|nr:ricin-type beta-trefoil lectin domain protein [Streptomyces sp. NBC_01176]